MNNYKDATNTPFNESLAGLCAEKVRLDRAIRILDQGLSPEAIAMTLQLAEQLSKVVSKIDALEKRAENGTPIRIM